MVKWVRFEMEFLFACRWMDDVPYRTVLCTLHSGKFYTSRIMDRNHGKDGWLAGRPRVFPFSFSFRDRPRWVGYGELAERAEADLGVMGVAFITPCPSVPAYGKL